MLLFNVLLYQFWNIEYRFFYGFSKKKEQQPPNRLNIDGTTNQVAIHNVFVLHMQKPSAQYENVM